MHVYVYGLPTVASYSEWLNVCWHFVSLPLYYKLIAVTNQVSLSFANACHHDQLHVLVLTHPYTADTYNIASICIYICMVSNHILCMYNKVKFTFTVKA